MASDSDLTTDDDGPGLGAGAAGIGPDDRTADITSAGGGPDSIDDIPSAAPIRPASAASSRSGPSAGGRLRYFGDYEIIRELARGGMGVVFLARQVSLNRTVAVKMILSGQFASEAAVARFHAEAEAAGALDHPNLVPIYETGRHDDQHYFSMKFVEGTNLAAEVPSLAADPHRAARLVATAARAVGYAHRRGVLHRDLKPANILIDTAGEPHVTDFGLAKMMDSAEGADGSGLTGTQAVMGTPSYMAPEQAAGHTRDVTTAADVYGMGAVLYETLSGKPPFREPTTLLTLMKVRSDPPPRPSTINPATPADLETICLKCLEKEPGRRYASCEALADELDRWVRGEPIEARPVGAVERMVLWAKRHPAIAGLLAALAVTVVVGAAGVLLQWREAVAARRLAESRTEEVRAQTARVKLELHRSEVRRGRALMEGGHAEEAEDILWRAYFTKPRGASPAAAGALWKLYREHPRARVLPGGPWRAMDLSADGSTLALVADDGGASRSITLFEAPTGRAKAEWALAPRSGRWITPPALSPDGFNVAIDNGTLESPGPQVWRYDGESPDPRFLARLPTPSGPVKEGGPAPSFVTRLTDDGFALVSDGKGFSTWRVRPTPVKPLGDFETGMQGVYVPAVVDAGAGTVLAMTNQAFRMERLTLEGGSSYRREVLAAAPDGRAAFVEPFDEPAGFTPVNAGQGAATPDGRRVVSQDTTGSLTCWDMSASGTVKRIGFDPTPHLVFDHVSMSRDGRRLAGSRGLALTVFDLPALDRVASIRLLGGGRLAGANLSPDGKELHAVEADGTACVYALPAPLGVPIDTPGGDAATTTGFRRPALPGLFGSDVTLSTLAVPEIYAVSGLGPIGPGIVGGIDPTGLAKGGFGGARWMALFTESGRIMPLRRPSGEESDDLTADKACVVSRDGSFCIMASDGSGLAGLEWNSLSDPSKSWVLSLPGERSAPAIVADAALARQDRMAVVGYTDSRVACVDLAERKVLSVFRITGARTIPFPAPVEPLAAALDTSGVVTVALPDGRLIGRAPGGALRGGFAWSADGRRLAAFGGAAGLDLWDVSATGTLTAVPAQPGAQLRVGSGGVFLAAAFLPDGRTLATGDDGGQLALWDVTTGEELWTLPVGGEKIMKVVAGGDGHSIRFVGKSGMGSIDLARPAAMLESNLPTRLRRLWPKIAGAGEFSTGELEAIAGGLVAVHPGAAPEIRDVTGAGSAESARR